MEPRWFSLRRHVACLSSCFILTQGVCPSAVLESTTISAASNGQTLTCPFGTFATGTCTTGSETKCPGPTSHQLVCSEFTEDSIDALSGSETDWVGSSVDDEMRFAACPNKNQVITSRCGSGAEKDCDFGNGNEHHGIRCRTLSNNFYMADTHEEYICTYAGVPGSCPVGYFPTSACGAGRLGTCDLLGCSGTNTHNGMRCVKWSYLDDLEWDTSAETSQHIIIENDINPLVGTIADLEVQFNAHTSASAHMSADFEAELDADGTVEGKLLNGFNIPNLIKSTLFGGNKKKQFAELEIEMDATAEATFAAAMEAQADAEAHAEFFSYRVSWLDSWSENFVRFIHYRRELRKEVVGTLHCCNCDHSGATVTTTFTTSQTGYLALHIKGYRGLNLEQMAAEDVVAMYLKGEIVSFSNGPLRRFIDKQTFFQRLWIFLGFGHHH